MFQTFGKKSLEYRIVYGLIIAGVPTLFLGSVIGIIDNPFLTIGISALAFLIISTITVGIGFLVYKNTKYQIDDNILALMQGLLSIHQVSIPFSKITNINFHQNVFQRLFQVGDLLVDQEDAENIITDIDFETFNLINKAVADKSNTQNIKSL